MGILDLEEHIVLMRVKDFVRDYALTCYVFDGNPEDTLIARLVYKYMRGSRVLDLGCGPVAAVLAIFYPDAAEAVVVDRLKENLDFVKNNSHELSGIMERAKKYKHTHLSRKDGNPRLKLVLGDITKRLDIGKFDSVMQIGCFGALDTAEQLQKAIDNAYRYLKPGGTLLMVNWLDEKGKVKRPFHFNGKVRLRELYIPSMQKSGFKIKEFHTTSRLSRETKKMGYNRIIWAVAKK